MLRLHRHGSPKRVKGGSLEAACRAELRFRLGLVLGVGVLWIVHGHAGSPGDFQLAYLDPGSGSFLIQALVALVAGIAVALRTYWDKVRSFLGLTGRGPSQTGADPSESDD